MNLFFNAQNQVKETRDFLINHEFRFRCELTEENFIIIIYTFSKTIDVYPNIPLHNRVLDREIKINSLNELKEIIKDCIKFGE
jgi:hypothetical protein